MLAVPGEVWGINAKTGKISWYAPGNQGASHSVVVADEVVYSVGGGRGGSSGIAIKLGGNGEITDPIWENKASGRFASPVVYKDHVYGISNGIITCYSAKDGKKVFASRLPAASSSGGQGGGGGRRRGRGGQEYASPIIAGGKIYFTSSSGTVYVLAAKPEFELIAKNDLSFDTSGFQSSPAADNGQLFLRSHKNLYCFSE